jgi:hypothetical protein
MKLDVQVLWLNHSKTCQKVQGILETNHLLMLACKHLSLFLTQQQQFFEAESVCLGMQKHIVGLIPQPSVLDNVKLDLIFQFVLVLS